MAHARPLADTPVRTPPGPEECWRTAPRSSCDSNPAASRESAESSSLAELPPGRYAPARRGAHRARCLLPNLPPVDLVATRARNQASARRRNLSQQSSDDELPAPGRLDGLPGVRILPRVSLVQLVAPGAALAPSRQRLGKGGDKLSPLWPAIRVGGYAQAKSIVSNRWTWPGTAALTPEGK